MYLRSLIIFPILLLGLPFLTIAQGNKLQFLLDKLNTARHDSDRMVVYYSLSRYYWDKDADSALLMGEKSLEMAVKIHNEVGTALAYLTQGVAYGAKGRFPQALKCHLEALRISEKLGMEGLSGNNYTNIGIVYSDMKDYPKAIEYFHKSLDISRRDKIDTLHYGIAAGYINLGDVFLKANQFDSAILYNKMALPIALGAKDSDYLGTILMNIGENYAKKKAPDSVIRYARKALEMYTAVQDEAGIAETDNVLGEAYYQARQYPLSILHAENALRRAQHLHTDQLALEACRILYSNYQDMGNYRQALEYRNKGIALQDSLFTLEKDKELKGLQSDYELAKKQHQIDLLSEEKTIRESKMARGRMILILSLLAVLLMGLCILFLYRGSRQKQRLNSLLGERNEEILRQNKDLESLNAVKNKLLSIIGHDLRSPIGTLKGFVDLLKKGALPAEKTAYFAEKMSENLTATSNLLDNLLFWAKSQMEGMTVNAAVFDLRELIGQNKKLAQHRADNKKISLLLDEDKGPLSVHADMNMLDMVLRNLVENAIKFSGEGGTVAIRTETSVEFTLVAIEDTGNGIAPEHQHKILNSSFSYTTPGTSKEKGSGLGLALCKELVEKNGGKIWFESEVGKGTRFLFTVPNEGVA